MESRESPGVPVKQRRRLASNGAEAGGDALLAIEQEFDGVRRRPPLLSIQAVCGLLGTTLDVVYELLNCSLTRPGTTAVIGGWRVVSTKVPSRGVAFHRPCFTV